MKTFTHSKSRQYENSCDEINWASSEDILKTSGDDKGYHLYMNHISSYRVNTSITLSPKEAAELRDDITQYLKRFD